MKIVIKESQYNTIREQLRIEYTPEKIDQLIIEAGKHLETFKKSYDLFWNKLMSVNVGEVFENPESLGTILQKLETVEEQLSKIHSKYYDVVQLYDTLDAPENVQRLDDIVNDLDFLFYNNFDNIKSAYESIFDAIKTLKERQH